MDETTRGTYINNLGYFQSMLETHPEKPDYFLPVAAMYAYLEKYEEVHSVCSKGLVLNPGHTQLQTLLAESMFQMGRKDEARELLFDILSSDEDNYKALKLLGMIFKNDENRSEAIKYLRTAYLKAPEDNELVALLEGVGGSVDRSVQSVPPQRHDEDFEEDDSENIQFNVSANISNAESIMADLLRDMIAQKSAGDMPVAANAARFAAPIPSKPIVGKELTDDEILRVLSDAPPQQDVQAAKETVHNVDIPTPAEANLADMLNSLSQDAEGLIPETEFVSTEDRDILMPIGAEPQFSFDADFMSELEEAPMPLEPFPPSEEQTGNAQMGDPAEESINEAEYIDTLSPDRLISWLQEAVPSPTHPSEHGDILEFEGDALSDWTSEEDVNKDDAFIPEPIVPADLIDRVFKESGMDDSDAEDERITPESVKREKKSEEKE